MITFPLIQYLLPPIARPVRRLICIHSTYFLGIIEGWQEKSRLCPPLSEVIEYGHGGGWLAVMADHGMRLRHNTRQCNRPVNVNGDPGTVALKPLYPLDFLVSGSA